MRDGMLTVGEAADLLGVSSRRVHALLEAGELAGERVAGRVVLSQAAVAAYRRRSGRKPLRSENAWALLALVSGAKTAGEVDRRRLWRSRRQLADLEKAGADWSVWLSLLRRRGDARSFRAHRSVLDRLAADPRLIRTGVSAARDHGFDVVGSGEVDAYVHARDVDSIVDEFVLEMATENPNVTLRVVPDDIAPAGGQGQGALWPAVLLDLLDSDDERTRRAGEAGFEVLRADLERRRSVESAGA